MISAYYGHEHLVDLLLKYNADSTVKNSQQYTALMYAKEYDFEPCVRLLSK
jgi:ankyrin repeat protein